MDDNFSVSLGMEVLPAYYHSSCFNQKFSV